MRKVIIYSALLFVGLGLSQALPVLLGDSHDAAATAIRVLTMTGLAFIMIQVGFEFHIDKARLHSYGVFILIVKKLIQGVPEAPAAFDHNDI